MTVYKTEKIASTLRTNHSTMSEVQDHFQSTATNEIQPPPSTPELDGPLIDCCPGGDIIPPSQISHDCNHYLNIPPPSDFATFNRCYLGDWSGVENLFQLPIRPLQEQFWPTEPTPPPPIPFGINEVVIEDTHEANVENLVHAMDNIILTQPNTIGEPIVVGLPYVDLDHYTLHPILPVPQNIRPWIHNDFPDGEHCYTMDNN